MQWVVQLDRILRGEATSAPALRQGTINLSTGGLVGGLIGMGAVYGVCMASFTMFQGGDQWWLQMIATALKVPALFLLTLLITFPSLYVFNTLLGSSLSFRTLFRLLLAVLGVTMVVLASIGPIIAFFAISTKSYSFMLLLNVAVFAVSGVLGLNFLLQTLQRLGLGQQPRATPPSTAITAEIPVLETLDPVTLAPVQVEPPAQPKSSLLVFRCWLVIFGIVGAQMGWVLRPFLGHGSLEFSWFRPRDSNFFEAVLTAFRHLFA